MVGVVEEDEDDLKSIDITVSSLARTYLKYWPLPN